MKASPDFVEKDLAPSWLETRRSPFFSLQSDKLIFYFFRALAALEEVSMNILTRRVG